ncbi:aldehyde reductase [Actinophytocola sp.]|uniref:SDR family oxidoreductase n=1 Tax=Actinophytocola sp. TaxID=1872138 RepID=UPI002ED7724E
MARVLVTGASGFVAGHCVDELLSHGYTVRGTVRTRRPDSRIEQVEADLTDDRGWVEAVAGCDAVLHVASPFPAGPPRDERELTGPAVDGTLRVLRAAAGAGVRRVVLTSSIAAITAGRPRGDDRVRTEADWSDVDKSSAYPRSKTLAERAAWRFAEEHPSLELVALNPGMVLGPIQHPSAATSVAVIGRLLNREMPAVPNLGFATVDVRDVATAHRLALETPGAAGNRYVLAGENVWFPEMAAILAEEFNPRGHRVPTGRLPYWLMWTLARFDRTMRIGLEFANRPENVTAEKAVRDLGWRQRPVRDSLVDTAESLLAHGLASRPKVSPAPSAGRRPQPEPRS